MLDVDAALLPYFYRNGVTSIDLYELWIETAYTEANGDYHFCSNTTSVGNYSPLAIKRSPVKIEEGTVLSEFEIGLDNVDLEFRTMVMNGLLSNKRCKVSIGFVNSGSIVGSVVLADGFIDEPKGDEHWITCKLKTFPVFEREYPKRVYQTGCNWTFCDQDTCGLSMADYYVDSTVGSGSDTQIINCDHGQVTDHFVPGYVLVMDGDYAGVYRPIVNNDETSVTLRVPFENTIPEGTAIRIQKLCAKNPATCQIDFENYQNYGGFPHCPTSPIL